MLRAGERQSPVSGLSSRVSGARDTGHMVTRLRGITSDDSDITPQWSSHYHREIGEIAGDTHIAAVKITKATIWIDLEISL